MKRFIVYSLVFVMLVGLFLNPGISYKEHDIMAESIIKYAEGEVENNGFENGIDSYWNVDESVDGSVFISTDEDHVYEGSKSLTISSGQSFTADVNQYISGLTPGYYYIELFTLNTGNQNACYFYGNGIGQGQCMTAIPVTTGEVDSVTDYTVYDEEAGYKLLYSGDWKKVTVRGIKVGSDGIMKLGLYVSGFDSQSVTIDSISIHYETNQDKQYESLYGGCISWLNWEEDMGAEYFYSDGTQGDPLQIMAESGFNFVRLELYNNPGSKINAQGDKFPEGYKDADDIFDLAQRANEKGMKIQLSFMYEDYWGDEVPTEWQEQIDGLTDNDEIVDTLTDLLYNYTKDFMQRLADAGIYPEYVSLGNEMQGGILNPYGSSYTSTETAQAFAKFINAGYDAVKEVSPDSQVVLHIACGGDDVKYQSLSGQAKWFFGTVCANNNIKYDVIGTSYYPYWSETVDVQGIVDWCNMMINTFDKDILVMESGYNWGAPGQLANNGIYEGVFDTSYEGQRDFMIELINGLKSVKDGRCVGDLYWDPILVRQEGIGWAINTNTGEAEDNCVETTTFFNYDHVALPVLNAYKYNQVGDENATIYGKVCDADGSYIPNTSVNITYGDYEYIINTDRLGTYYAKVLPADTGEISLSIDSYEDIARYTDVNISAGDFNKIDFVLGDSGAYEEIENTITFHYYYDGAGPLYITFDNPISETQEYEIVNGKYGYLMNEDGENWYSFDIKRSYGGFDIVEGASVLTTLGETVNSAKYEKLMIGYYTYYYYGYLFEKPEKAFASYYIAGSTNAWDTSDPGIFSNYWAQGGKWLDKFTLDDNGEYTITLGKTVAGTTYAFGVYMDASWDNKIYSASFTADGRYDVKFKYDPELCTVSYEFIEIYNPLTIGDGTEDSPYEIYNYEDLVEFGAIVNGKSDINGQNAAACAVLMNDITINNEVIVDGELNEDTSSFNSWTPIGSSTSKYTGHFNGNFHTISGVYIPVTGANKALFGYVSTGGTIENLGVVDSYVKGSLRTSVLVGYALECTVTNCYVEGIVTASSAYSSGLVAYAKTADISDCYSNAVVTGSGSSGAIVGAASDSVVLNCYYMSGTAQGGIKGSDIDGSAQSATEEQFNSGEVAWLLNSDVYGQIIGTDACPQFVNDENHVYKVTKNIGEEENIIQYCNRYIAIEVPDKSGNLFVAWYLDEELQNVFSSEDGLSEDISLYARWIDEKALTVKVQIPDGTAADSEKTSIRFVSSIDSADYDSAGFIISYEYNGIAHNSAKSVQNLYLNILASGTLCSPDIFCDASQYFFAYAIRNVPNDAFDTTFEVTPYVTVGDNITYGSTRAVSIDNIISAQ